MAEAPNTVIGLFGNIEAARRAVHELTTHGFDADHVDLSDHDIATTENPTGEFPENDSLHHFLRRYFTSDTEERLEAETAHRGGVVAVHLDSWAEADRARSLFEQCGAVDVHQIGIVHRGAMANTPQDDEIRRITHPETGPADRPAGSL
ncbi:hypothetical protein [Hymenobacter sp. B81]|uniref:hypothetical protein n=1 Tax=Hymenobacter sp. B81 TaxID=3344878 RepID=UPI0037DDC230